MAESTQGTAHSEHAVRAAGLHTKLAQALTVVTLAGYELLRFDHDLSRPFAAGFFV